MLSGVTIRDQEWDVEWECVEDDPTTNAFEIEWHFYNADAPRDLTDKEHDTIIEQLAEIYHEGPGGPEDWD